MILVMAMIGIAIFLFIVEWVRVDVVAILMMVALPLLGLISPKEAFVGMSSNAVISIIAVIIIGAGLDRTGLINRLVGPILQIAGASKSRVVIAISLTVAGISSFMQNIGAAALFLPAVQRISKTMKIPLSQLLMPIGFSAILGGTVTLVGCSPLILLNDLLEPFGLKPFGLFDVTPIGLALVASGIGCFIFLGRFILPKGTVDVAEEKPRNSLENTLKEMGETYEIQTSADFTHYREPVLVDDLKRRYLVTVLAMTEPPDFKTLSPTGDQEMLSTCICWCMAAKRMSSAWCRKKICSLKKPRKSSRVKPGRRIRHRRSVWRRALPLRNASQRGHFNHRGDHHRRRPGQNRSDQQAGRSHP